MCKKIFVLAIAVFLIATLFNQGFAQDKAVRFGVRIGFSGGFTNVEIAGMNREPRLGFVAGGLFEYWLNYRFAIQANPSYLMKGAKYSLDLGIASTDLTWKFDYLSIPILAKIAFGERTRFYLVTGPELAFLLSSNQKIELKGLGLQESEEDDLKDYMNSTEVALALGFGVEIPMGSTVFFIESRGSLGFTDIFKDIPSGFFAGEDKAVRNLFSSFAMGLAF